MAFCIIFMGGNVMQNDDFNTLVEKYKADMLKLKPHYSGNEPSCGSEKRQQNTDIPTVRDMDINAVPPLSVKETVPLTDPRYLTSSEYPVRESEEWETESGGIKVYVYTARQGLPVEGADVTISRKFDNREVLHIFTKTNLSGETDTFYLPAPPKELSQTEGNEHPYADYNIRIDAPGFYTVEKTNVPIFGGENSVQPVEMIPISENESTIKEKIVFESESADL